MTRKSIVRIFSRISNESALLLLIVSALFIKSFDVSKRILLRTENTILFLQTSETPLSPLEECALLSACEKNRNKTIILLSVGYHQNFSKCLINQPNFRNQSLNLQELFSETPLYAWYERKAWNESQKAIRFLSDAARLAYLYQFGGIYMDTDIISLKSVPSDKNFITRQNKLHMNNAVMGFQRRHPILNYMMTYLAENFNSTNREIVYGPGLLTKAYVYYGIHTRNWPRIKVIRRTDYYPISFRMSEMLLRETKVFEHSLKVARGLHLWRHQMGNKLELAKSNSVLRNVLNKHCKSLFDK